MRRPDPVEGFLLAAGCLAIALLVYCGALLVVFW